VEASVDARGGDTRAAWQTTDLVLKRRSLSSLLTSALAMSQFQGREARELDDSLFHGRRMTLEILEILLIDGGKILGYWVFYDRLSLMH